MHDPENRSVFFIMKTKKCKECNEVKLLSEFYKHKMMVDGHLNICKVCKRKYQNIYLDNNRERVNEYVRNHFRNNKEYYHTSATKWKMNKRKTDPLFRLKDNIWSNIKGSFTRKVNGKFKTSKNSEEILGCSIGELIIHLESQFKDGMTIENHGTWEIDHIIPLKTAKTKNDIIRLNHYTNLQPLWMEENRRKAGNIK